MATARRLNFGRYDYAIFLVYFAYAAGSVVIPVALVDLARELGFSLESGGMSAGGALHLGRTLPMVAALLLSGFAAGHWGTRGSLAVGALGMGVGMLLCAVAPGYGVLFLALLVAGCGEGVIEGLGTPFVQDLHPEEPGRYINFAHAFWSIGVLVTVLGCGFLLARGVSWRLLVGGVASLGFVATLLVLARPRRGPAAAAAPPPPARRHWRCVWRQTAAILRESRFWVYFAAMFLAGGGEFCLTFWTASHVQLRYGASAWSGGLATAFFAAGMVAGRTGGAWLVGQRHLRHLIVYSAIGGTAVCLLLPAAGSLPAFFTLLFLAGLATAPYWPSIQSYATDRLPGTDTTMLLILLACAGVPGCGVFTWLMGVWGNRGGDLTAAFYLVPLCYAGLGLLIAADWAWSRHPDAPAAVAAENAGEQS